MQKLPQVMINVPTNGDKTVCENGTVKSAVKNAEETMAGRGRVLLRPSGTEPLIRVMVEGEQQTLVAQLANELAEVVKKEVA